MTRFPQVSRGTGAINYPQSPGLGVRWPVKGKEDTQKRRRWTTASDGDDDDEEETTESLILISIWSPNHSMNLI